MNIEVQFIVLTLFTQTVMFRLNHSKWLWARIYQPLVDCSFCHGFWVGSFIWSSLVIIHTLNISFYDFYIHSAAGSLICLIYDTIILKETNNV